MRKITILLFVCFSISAIYAQKQKEYLESGKKHRTVKVYKKDYQVLRAKSLQLVNDSTISFKKNDSASVEQMSLDKIRYFSVVQGNKAVPYGLFGAGMGVLIVLYAVKDVETNSNYEYRDNLGLRIALIIGGFGALGAGIGALSPKWKRLYIKDKQTKYSYFLYPKIQRNQYSLGLIVKF